MIGNGVGKAVFWGRGAYEALRRLGAEVRALQISNRHWLTVTN